VASLVSFIDGLPFKPGYRRYRIKPAGVPQQPACPCTSAPGPACREDSLGEEFMRIFLPFSRAADYKGTEKHR
jgi:hypothetical protein